MAYTPLRISTVKPKKEITFDLYIFYQEQFLKYIDVGNFIEPEHLKKLRKQKIARFFITDNDEIKYQAFLDDILNEAMNDESTPVEEKVELAEGAAGTAVERMQEDPGSQGAYTMTEKAGKNLRKIVSKNPGALSKVFGKQVEEGEIIVKHCLNVCALSTKLGEIVGCSEAELDDIATAALVHDIGITKLPGGGLNLFTKSRKNFSLEEKKTFNTHTKLGAELLNDKSYITPQIIRLVLNHEENLSGSGPLKKQKLEKLEEIISLVDCYDLKVTVDKMTPKEALKDFQVSELGNYNLETIELFKSVVKSEGLLDL